MSNLSVNPNVKIETSTKDSTYIISTHDAVILKCSKCGGMKDVSLHQDPTAEEMQSGHQLKTGTVSYPMMSQCRCGAPNDGGDVQKLLADINLALDGCHTIQDVRNLLIEVAIREYKAKR